MIKYKLEPKETKKFEGKSGIYGIVYDQDIIYVGQSKNIGRRLREHGKENKLNDVISQIIQEQWKCNRYKQLALYRFIENNRDDIFFVVLEQTENLDEREEYYISTIKPRFNYKGIDVPYKKPEPKNSVIL